MKEIKLDTYESPEVKIVETKVRNVICTSGGTEQYNGGDTTTWF